MRVHDQESETIARRIASTRKTTHLHVRMCHSRSRHDGQRAAGSGDTHTFALICTYSSMPLRKEAGGSLYAAVQLPSVLVYPRGPRAIAVGCGGISELAPALVKGERVMGGDSLRRIIGCVRTTRCVLRVHVHAAQREQVGLWLSLVSTQTIRPP